MVGENIKKAKVFLAGAGPGKADLVTVATVNALAICDCVIYDKLVNKSLLKHASPKAEKIAVPKRIANGSVDQATINNIILKKAGEGKIIVRLKGGDPCMFGRGAEEAKLLKDAGIDFEIIPAVTAAVAAAEFAGCILTNRNYSSQVVFVTARQAGGKIIENVDWKILANIPATVVFYMGLNVIDEITQKLMAFGMAQDYPAAVISKATMPNQKTIRATVSDVACECAKQKIKSPAIIIFGKAAAPDEALKWLQNKPLFGKKIIITRDEKGNDELAQKLETQSAEVIRCDTVTIESLLDDAKFRRILKQIEDCKWLIFTSKIAVQIFFDWLKNSNKDCRALAGTKIAAIGTQTSKALADVGIIVDFMPKTFTSKQLGQQLIKHAKIEGENILLLRSDLASDELGKILAKAKANVKTEDLYSLKPSGKIHEEIKQQIDNGEIDWVMFASGFCAKVFIDKFGKDRLNSSKLKIAAIGPVTAKQIDAYGIHVDAVAGCHTIDGLIDVIKATAND